ncbi:hypothetical protein D3C73_1102960 [compost metagenome]
MAAGHAQQCVLGAKHRPDHIGFHHLEQAELRHAFDTALLADGAGVVHQCGDGAELFIDAMKQLDHLVLDTGVCTHTDGLGAECAHLGKNALRGLVIGVVVDADAVTLAGGLHSSGGADATAGAGDDNDFLHGPAKSLGKIDPTIGEKPAAGNDPAQQVRRYQPELRARTLPQ